MPARRMRSRRRSNVPVAPASRPSTTTGSAAAVCIARMSNGEFGEHRISQVPAVSCIHVPRLEDGGRNKAVAEEPQAQWLKAGVCGRIGACGFKEWPETDFIRS